MIVQCTYCGKDVNKRPHQLKNKDNIFCDRECYHKWRSKNKSGENNPKFSRVMYSCDNCKEQFLIKQCILKDLEKGKRKNIFCSTSCHNQFRKLNNIKLNTIRGTFKIECKHCGKEFHISNHQKERAKFCSKKCKYEHKIDRIQCKCINCGMEFEKLPSQSIDRKFCDNKCMGQWQEKHNTTKVVKNCLICGKQIKLSPCLKERFLCSRECVREWQKGEKYISIRRELSIKQMKNQSKKDTKPERMVREFLTQMNIEFIPQHPFYNKFVVDFYLPDHNIIIEVQGDFWHGNPSIYGTGEGLKPLRDRQIKQIEKDKYRYSYLRNKNHLVYFVWEQDIYDDIDTTLYFLKSLNQK